MTNILTIIMIITTVAGGTSAYIYYNVFRDMDNDDLEYNFGEIIIKRIKNKFYKKMKVINDYDDYSSLEDEEDKEFINYWYLN